MKILRFTLILACLICLGGFAGVFIPMKFILPLASRYGVGEGSAGPLFVLVFRLASAVIAGCSVFFYFLFRDPVRHGPLVPATGGLLVFAGMVLSVTGIQLGMHLQVYLFDSISCILVGVAIVASWLKWGRSKKG